MFENKGLLLKLSRALGLPSTSLQALARTAPYRYKVYSIPKRSGRGNRIIAQPAREVKAVQRWLVSQELAFLPVHQASTAYGKGCSILDNAQRHAGNRFLLKADFADFFPSIDEYAVRTHLATFAQNQYAEIEINFICRLLLWHEHRGGALKLCIGAPSSPFIANTVVYALDLMIQDYCSSVGVIYSRYADDLVFSTSVPGQLTELPGFLRRAVAQVQYPRLRLNEEKFVFTSKKYRRSVTGLVITPTSDISIGRDRKRLIRSMVHYFLEGRLDDDEKQRLRGLIAFAQATEPSFVRRLERYYSVDVIRAIQRFARAKRRRGY